MLDLIGLSAIALSLNISDRSLNSFQPTPLWYQSEIVREFPWQQAKGRHYESTYEREATRRDREEDDLEEIRSRDYEERRRGYGHEEDDYYRRDRYRDEERYQHNRHRREIFKERNGCD